MQHVQAGQADHADPERLGQPLGGRDADPQTGEEPRPQVDRHGLDVAGLGSPPDEEVLQRRRQRLDVTAAPGEGELGLGLRRSVRTATPTVSVAVSMATMFTGHPGRRRAP